MNEQLIPQDIAGRIDAKRASLAAESAIRESQQEELRRATIAQGRERAQAAIAELLTKVPEWLRPYAVNVDAATDEQLEHIGSGVNMVKRLRFEVPGLTAILFDPAQGYVAQWAKDRHWNYSGRMDEPALTFADTRYSQDLEFVMLQAADAMVLHEQNMANYRQWLSDEAAVREAEQHEPEAPAEPREQDIQLTPSERNLISALRMWTLEQDMLRSES